MLKAIELKIAGQEIQRVEVEARPPTWSRPQGEPRTEGTGEGCSYQGSAGVHAGEGADSATTRLLTEVQPHARPRDNAAKVIGALRRF